MVKLTVYNNSEAIPLCSNSKLKMSNRNTILILIRTTEDTIHAIATNLYKPLTPEVNPLK